PASVAEPAILERDALDQGVDAAADVEPELVERLASDAGAEMPAVDGEEQLDVDGADEVDAEDLRVEHVADADRMRFRRRNRDVARMDPQPDAGARGRFGERDPQPLLAEHERRHAGFRALDDRFDERAGLEPSRDGPQVDALQDIADGAAPYDAAFAEEHDAGREAGDLVDAVRHVQHGQPERLRQPLDV